MHPKGLACLGNVRPLFSISQIDLRMGDAGLLGDPPSFLCDWNQNTELCNRGSIPSPSKTTFPFPLLPDTIGRGILKIALLFESHALGP